MSLRSLRRDIDKLKAIQADKSDCGGIEVYFASQFTSPEELQERIRACPGRKMPLIIEFIGPEGGPELGTGPFEDEEYDTSDPDH